MKGVSKIYILFAVMTLAAYIDGQTEPPAQLKDPLFVEFETRAKEYSRERERLERELPPLAKKATPEEVMAHKEALRKAVQQYRGGAKQGDIFLPEISQQLKVVIAAQLDGADRVKLRKAVLEAENKAVQKRVNYPYPESQEILEMPPTLLMILPQLPKQLRYRFVGRDLLLVDRENLLIIDLMKDAVP